MITANMRKTANALVYAAMCGQVDRVRKMLDFSPSLVHPGVRCEDDFMGPGVQAHPALDVACEYWMLPRNDKGIVSDRKLGGDVVAQEAVVRLLLVGNRDHHTMIPRTGQLFLSWL